MDLILEPQVVKGFRFAGVAAGLRKEPGRKDLGVIVADRPVAAAGVFTTNRVKAAPVVVTQEHIRRGRLQAVAANSGSANCFTGKAGIELARESCAALAAGIECAPELVASCSTGVIGRLYDLEKYRGGIHDAVAALSPTALEDFARAIMTTDTHPKIASVRLRLGGAEVTVAGCAKGAGMIEPKMATMLAFVVTDAAVGTPELKRTLKRALPESFNAITVDGDMSTNDTLLLMASGAAGGARTLKPRELAAFGEAVTAVARALARELVRAGEATESNNRARGSAMAAATRSAARTTPMGHWPPPSGRRPPPAPPPARSCFRRSWSAVRRSLPSWSWLRTRCARPRPWRFR